MWRDPRHYQLGALYSLFLYGAFALGFDVKPLHVVLTIATAAITQVLFSWIFRVPVELRSALITSCSLCLLLRSSVWWVPVFAAFVAMGSKFVLRWNGKHIFNPANGAIILCLLVFDNAWVSPGQWGNTAFFGFLFACLGGLVVMRAKRADVSLAFLFFYSAMIFARSLYLGEPMTIPFHRLESGALLLFTFFMISDPKTTPNSRVARILYAFLVAAGAYYVTFKMFRTNGLLWSLVVVSLLVPFMDLLFRGEIYQWRKKDEVQFSS